MIVCRYRRYTNNSIKIIYDEKHLPINPNIDIKSASTLPGFIVKVWNPVEKSDYVPEGQYRESICTTIIGGTSDVNKKGKFDFTGENKGSVIDLVS